MSSFPRLTSFRPMYCMRCPFLAYRVCGCCCHIRVAATRDSSHAVVIIIASSFCTATRGSIRFDTSWLQRCPIKHHRDLDPKHAERQRAAKEGNIRICSIEIFRIFNNRQSRKSCTELPFTSSASGTRGIWQAWHVSTTIFRNSYQKA